MRNGWLAEAQAGIKISRRNINNLRYARMKAMANQFGALAWEILWMEEPIELPSVGRTESDTTDTT